MLESRKSSELCNHTAIIDSRQIICTEKRNEIGS